MISLRPNKIEWATPKELGLPFPEMPKIFIGNCGALDNIHFQGQNWGIVGPLAHTHKCPKEEIFNCVCISHGNEILNYDGSPSDAMWHEYGHVLWDFPEWIRNWRCVEPIAMHSFEYTKIDKNDYRVFDPHDEVWKQIMINVLQKPHITSLWVNSSIKMAQAAAQIK